MKKIIFSVVALLMLSGCSVSALPKTADISEVYKKDFSALVTVEYGEETAKMEITKNGMSISFLLREPEELSGMSMVLFDEHAKVTYEGMTQDIDADKLPDSAPFLLLEELFDELSEPDEFVLSAENGEIIVQGDDFIATLYTEDFSLKNAVFPRFDTEFVFERFEFFEEK